RPAPGNLLPDPAAGGGPAMIPDGAPTTPAPARGARDKPSSKGSSLPERVAGAVEVWTDGACSGNPGPMGIGVVVIDGPKRRELGEYLGSGTNNIAELVAIERGIVLAAELTGGDTKRPLRVYSD